MHSNCLWSSTRRFSSKCRITTKHNAERRFSLLTLTQLMDVLCSDCEKAITRYDGWLQLREQAIANHRASGSSSTLPKSITDPPPPRPEPFQDEEMTDVSVDMTANGFDASESFTLDRSIADEVVPVADPGIDRPSVSSSFPSRQVFDPYSPSPLWVLGSTTMPQPALHLLAHISVGSRFSR